MQILVLDNYDSFTYNLVACLEQFAPGQVAVRRNDEISLPEVEPFDKILLSPGPGLPSESGVLLPLIKEFAPRKSIFGVCLGQQAIAEAFGGGLKNLGRPFHGVATKIKLEKSGEPLFRGLPREFLVGRYHSWVVDKKRLPDCFDITATDEAGELMAISHREFDVRAVQFHPESVMTEFGLRMIENWLNN